MIDDRVTGFISEVIRGCYGQELRINLMNLRRDHPNNDANLLPLIQAAINLGKGKRAIASLEVAE